MNFLRRAISRIFTFFIGATMLALIITQVFNRLDQKLPFFIAAITTYIVSAYFLLPRLIHIWVVILRRGHIPRVTYTIDGLPADPVNILLVGNGEQLTAAFTAAGWTQADKLTIVSRWKMIKCFIFNQDYPSAPFSALYLFGRTPDYEFQKAISSNPRKRHHILFWAANVDPQTELIDLQYWTKKRPVDVEKSLIWVGAGTKDIGFGLKKLTYQISHRIDKKIDRERNYILSSLKKSDKVYDLRLIQAGEHVNKKYISDGKILCMRLK